jgi:hypothetical protein
MHKEWVVDVERLAKLEGGGRSDILTVRDPETKAVVAMLAKEEFTDEDIARALRSVSRKRLQRGWGARATI